VAPDGSLEREECRRIAGSIFSEIQVMLQGGRAARVEVERRIEVLGENSSVAHFQGRLRESEVAAERPQDSEPTKLRVHRPQRVRCNPKKGTKGEETTA
jgi:hypothetical protein